MLAHSYRKLSDEENKSLETAVEEDKQRYIRESNDSNAQIGLAVNSEECNELTFPVSKTRRSVKMDPDIKTVGKESAVAITKAAELFVAFLSLRCVSSASLRGAKSIKETDVIYAIHNSEALHFLKVDFPKPVLGPATKVSKTAAIVPQLHPAAGKKGITSFFVQAEDEAGAH